jgi:hypothetical protein
MFGNVSEAELKKKKKHINVYIGGEPRSMLTSFSLSQYIKSMPKLNDADERRKQSRKPGPVQLNPKYTRGTTSSGNPTSSTRCQRCEKLGYALISLHLTL